MSEVEPLPEPGQATVCSVILRTADAVQGLRGLVRYRHNASGRTQRELTTAAA